MKLNPLDQVRDLTDAWLAKDQEGMSRCLTDDIIEIGPEFERILVGKRSFFRAYRPYFQGPLQIRSYRILRPRTVYLSRTLALVFFQYRMRIRTRGRTLHSRGKESMILVRKRSTWLVKCIHWHRDP